MSGANPWSVKGIDPKVREAARDAARRQGMTLGEYLNQALAQHEASKQLGDEPLLQRPPRGIPRPSSFYEDYDDDADTWAIASARTPTNPRLADPMVRLTQKLDAIERRTQLAITGLDRTVSTIDRSLLGLAQRVDEAEAGANDAADKVVEALEQFRTAHEHLSAKLKDAEAQTAESRRVLEGANANLDDVRAALERRVDAAEQSSKEAEATAVALANRIAATDETLSRKIAEFEAHSRAEVQAAIAEARAAIAEATKSMPSIGVIDEVKAQQDVLNQRLATTEHAARQAAHNALAEARSARQELTERIERIEHEARAQGGGGEALGELRAAQDVLARRIAACEGDVKAGSETAFEEMRRIQTALNARLDRFEAQAPPDAGSPSASILEDIRATQAALTQRLAKAEQDAREMTAGLRQAAGAAVADLRNAQLGLAARMKQLEERPAPEHSAAAGVAELQSRVADLAQRIGDAETRGAQDSDNLRNETRSFGDRLDQALRDLSDRLGANETGAIELNGAVRSIEDSVQRLQERIALTETAANTVVQKLEETVAAVSAKDDSAATEALRAMFEKRLDELGQSTEATIASARADVQEQITAALSGLRADEIDNSIAEVNRRLASAERRQAQTIEAISIEIKRMSETIDRRLRNVEANAGGDSEAVALREEMDKMSRALELRFEEIERREAAGFDRVTLEIGRVAERMDERVASVETRSAHAIEQIGEQIARMAERFNTRQDMLARDISSAEVRMGERIEDVLANMHQRVAEVEDEDSTPPPEPPRPAGAAPNLANALRAGPVASDAFFAEAPSEAHDDFLIDDDENTPLASQDPALADDFSSPDDDIETYDDEVYDEPVLDAPTFPHFGDPKPDAPASEALDDYQLDDAPPFAPPIEAKRDEPEPPPVGDFDPFEDADIPLPSLLPENEAHNPAPPRKDDYLAAARRAALAQAAAPPKKGRARTDEQKPVTGLRGPGRVVLWGAAGAVAAALVGGMYYLRAQGEQRPAAASPTRARAPAAPAPATPAPAAEATPFSDAPLAEPEAPPPEAAPAASEGIPQAEVHPQSGSQASATPARAMRRAAPITPVSANLEQAAAQGDAVAQYDLALARISASETADGVALLRRAAAQGLAMAQYRLAKLYERGEGVPQDLAQSRQWTERAANGGNRRAMHDLGVFFARGEGAPLDEQAAFRWFRQAAELGVTDSQYNLGVLYQQGRGVTANPAEAMFWFLVAARSGDADARQRGAALEANLTQTQADQARTRANAFRPRAASARANGEFGVRPWSAPTPRA